MTGIIRIAPGADVSAILCDLLELTGTRPAQLARITGFDEGQISKWRHGIVIPSAPYLLRLLNGFGYQLAIVPLIETAPETVPPPTLADDHPPAGVLGCTEGQKIAPEAPEAFCCSRADHVGHDGMEGA